MDWKQKLIGISGAESKVHLVFLPTYKEGYEIIETTLTSLQHNSFPAHRMIIVIGGEEGDKTHFQEVAARAQAKFGDVFKKLIVTMHPKGLPGEMSGKGSNLNWMGHRTEEVLKAEFPELKDEDVIVSALIRSHMSIIFRTSRICTAR